MLVRQCGFQNRMPRIVPCGGRANAFDQFKTALTSCKDGDVVALWVDSEDPVADIEKTWTHLRTRDNWDRPTGAADDHVLLMTTCMETLIIADRATLQLHYGQNFKLNILPPRTHLETRSRHEVQDALVQSTKGCSNAYTKGKRSYEVLGKLNPATLEAHLPSFARTRRILEEKLK